MPDFPFPEGYVLPVDKPLGWTSSDVVRKMRVLLRRLGHRKIKVGHAGTLDPLATVSYTHLTLPTNSLV